MAALSGHEKIVKLLLANGALVTAATSQGWTALHCALRRWPADGRLSHCPRCDTVAACAGDKAVIGALIARGAPLDARDSDGDTPLHGACAHAASHAPAC